MKKILKQVVGIDVAQKELVVCLGRLHEDLSCEVYSSKTFVSNPKGFMSLVVWVKKLTDPAVPVSYVMEATGVYHEPLAYFLDQNGFCISIVLPNKISNYFRTLDVKTVNDKTASQAITRFGLERQLDSWHRPAGIFKRLRQLTRERDQVIQHRTITKNQLHAERSEAEPNKSTIARLKRQLDLFNSQEQQITQEIKELISQDHEVSRSVRLICSISGIGIITCAIVLAETNGFDLIRNKRQLASYAGFDVKEKQSGTSVRGQPRISKKGNKYLRKAMHLPALAAIRCDERFKSVFARLVAKHGIKMKAAVAVQRKLLEMIFTIYRTGRTYDKAYLKKLESNQVAP